MHPHSPFPTRLQHAQIAFYSLPIYKKSPVWRSLPNPNSFFFHQPRYSGFRAIFTGGGGASSSSSVGYGSAWPLLA